MQEVILFYNGLGIPTRQILDSRGAIPSKTTADAKVAIQEMVEYSQKWHNGTSRSRSTETSNGLAAIQAQLNNLGREIKKERGFGSLPSSTEANPRDQVKSISTTIEADSCPIRRQFLKELCTNTFSGSDHEDANEHIEKVLEIVDLFHIPNITIDQMMLRAFPMSVTGAASRWLRNEPTGSITTRDGLKTKFLNKYYPPARTVKKMEEINNFQQEPDENL
ncbi:hypothetical protein Tco_1196753 [Tanacetum coccineum]